MHRTRKVVLVLAVVILCTGIGFWAYHAVRNLHAESTFAAKTNKKNGSFTDALAAYRTLMEQVGVATAQDILLRTLPNDSRTHMINHETGFFLYKREGVQGIRGCKPYFAGGCFHGFVEAHIAAHGYENIEALIESCRTLTAGEQEMQCPHGVGHAMLIAADYENLPGALALCEAAFPEDRKSRVHCYDGVFMENSFGAFSVPPADRWYQPDDPMYPCNEPEVLAYEGAHLYCWAMQSQATLRADAYPSLKGEVGAVGKFCATLSTAADHKLCIQGIARQLQWKYPNDFKAVERACEELPHHESRQCLWYAYKVAYIYGDRSKETMRMCEEAGALQDMCYRIFFEGIAIAYSNQERRERACEELPGYQDECVTWMRSPQAAQF